MSFILCFVVLNNLLYFMTHIKCRHFEHKLPIMLFISLFFFCFSTAHHLWSTGRHLPSASSGHRLASQNNHWTHQLHLASSTQQPSSPSKDVMTQTFVFNRKLQNVDTHEAQHIHSASSMESAQPNHLHNDQWRRETNNIPQSNTNVSSDMLSDPARPFAISIEGKLFYGGLITYSHDLHPARICRVMNACVRNDDTLVLPQWMQRHDNTLIFQCGYPNIDFSLSDNEPPPPLNNLDLVGVRASRPSMPDFIRDFIPSTIVFDLVYGDHQVFKSCHSREGKDCYSFPLLKESFRPAVILHSRIRLLEEKKSWVRQFVELMKPPYDGRKTEILYEDSFRRKDADITCFRSVMFTRGPFNRNFIMDDHLRQIHFLSKHGIVKKPREVLQSQDSFSLKKECSLNVTITNRKRVDGVHNTLIGRYITNLPTIRDAIAERAQRIPGLHINIAAITLEDKTLQWQINAMQKTDIWVAGHGPLLTNMLFLREQSSVLELQPFAYYPQTYEKFAERLAHVAHERYIADPDVEAFTACINQIYDDKDPARNEVSKLLDRYMQASKKYFESDNTHTLILHNLSGEDMLPVKKCAEMQRLTVNARNFAVAVVRHARVRCGLPIPTLSNSTAEQIPSGYERSNI